MYGIKSESKIWTLDKKFKIIIPEGLKYIADEAISKCPILKSPRLTK
jgi:hypothetical protein